MGLVGRRFYPAFILSTHDAGGGDKGLRWGLLTRLNQGQAQDVARSKAQPVGRDMFA